MSSEGFTKQFASELLQNLKQSLPTDMSEQLCGHELKGTDLAGMRGYAIEVAVKDIRRSPAVVELVAKKFRAEPELMYLPPGASVGSERRLFVVAERSEADKVRYRMMGKAKDRLSKARQRLGASAVGELSFAWKPKFAVLDEDDEVVVQVRPGGTLHIDDTLAQKYFSKAARELRKLVAGSV